MSKKPSRQAILPQKHPDFRVIARPQRGRGNLKVKGIASRGEAREHVAKRNTYHYAASFRPAIFRYGMTNRFVKDCRVGRKECALLAMTESVGLIENTERKFNFPIP